MPKGAKGTESSPAPGDRETRDRETRDRETKDSAKNLAKDRPLYVISVAAELVDMHPQTLRLYERKGLIEPQRSSGKTRLYSERDIEQLREIRRLTQELGVNLAGVEEIIRLRRSLDELQGQMEGRISFLQSRLSDRLLKLSMPLEAPADESADETRVSGES